MSTALRKRCWKILEKITGTYEELLEENRAHLQPMMERSTLNLEGDWALSAEELLQEQHSRGVELSPMMMESYRTWEDFS